MRRPSLFLTDCFPGCLFVTYILNKYWNFAKKRCDER